MNRDNLWGRTADELLVIAQAGKGQRRGIALSQLVEMLACGAVTNKKFIYRVAQAAANATHSDVGAVRVRAYGVVGFLARWYAFDLRRSKSVRDCQIALRMLIRTSNLLHEDLIAIVPDIVAAMTADIATKRTGWDQLATKFRQEVASRNGAMRNRAQMALDHVESAMIR